MGTVASCRAGSDAGLLGCHVQLAALKETYRVGAAPEQGLRRRGREAGARRR